MVFVSACVSGVPSQLTRNQKLWESKNINNYDFTVERQCFCPEDYRGPVNIQVRNDAPTSVTYVSSGADASGKFGDTDTVDELFTALQNAYEGNNSFSQKAARVDVTYDSQYGYPTSIYIDISPQIADEEQGFEVTNFKVIQ